MPRGPDRIYGDYKFCTKCEKLIHIENFTKAKTSKDGLNYMCRICVKQYNKINSSKYYMQNRSTIVEKTANYKNTIEGRAKMLIASAKLRADARTTEFDISLDFVKIILLLGKCQKSGLDFVFTKPKNKTIGMLSPTIDRIDNNIGYVTENIQVVCAMYNFGKNQHTDIEFIAFCCAIAEKHSSRSEIQRKLSELRNAII